MSNGQRSETDRERVEAFVRRQAEKASERMLNRTKLDLLDAASQGLSRSRFRRLQKDALALCGHPAHAVSHQRWSEAAWRFLAEFVEDEEE